MDSRSEAYELWSKWKGRGVTALKLLAVIVVIILVYNNWSA